MSHKTEWFGFLKLFGTWRKVTGPHPDMGSASRALDAEVRRRKICIAQRWLRITAGATPRDE